MTRIALSLAFSLALVTGAQAQPAQRGGNDAEIQQKAPARDYAAEAKNRLQSAMDGRVTCLQAAGVKEKADFTVRNSTKVSVRDGAYNDYDASAIQKCLVGAN